MAIKTDSNSPAATGNTGTLARADSVFRRGLAASRRRGADGLARGLGLASGSRGVAALRGLTDVEPVPVFFLAGARRVGFLGGNSGIFQMMLQALGDGIGRHHSAIEPTHRPNSVDTIAEEQLIRLLQMLKP